MEKHQSIYKLFGEWGIKLKNKYSSSLAKKMINRLLVSTFIYTLIFIILWTIGREYCKLFTWQPDDITYIIFKNFEENIALVIIVWLIGFSILFVYYLRKILSYIDTIVEASYKLSNNDNDWIKLPNDLIEIEASFNQFKQVSNMNFRLAQDNEERKNNLVAYLAHDIKTPLTSLIGYLSLLDEVDDMPVRQRKKYIKIALDKSYRLDDLINELFDITRYNSKEMVISKDELNLNLMLEQIADDFYPVLKQSKKEIVIKSVDKIILNGDSDKLARVFNNVIKNAISYGKENSKITIEVLKKDNYANVIISNKGKKISEDVLNKIFEKFYRVDSSRTSNTGGSGLGLAIAKEIVELHNGKIWASSDDEATKFYIKLPID